MAELQSENSSGEESCNLGDMTFTNYLLPMRMMTHEEENQVRVEFFTNERSIKERLQLYFIKNQRSSLRIRLFNFMIKILTCALYIIRVILDTPRQVNGCCGKCKNHTFDTWDNASQSIYKVHWHLILFVNRSDPLWLTQVVVAIISLSQSCLIAYLGYKGNIWYSLLAPSFLLECVNSVPFIVTTFNSIKLKCLFIPVFLNCWLAKKQLEDMFGDLNRILQRTSSALSIRVMKVISTTFCLIFTSTCGVQHLQRGGYRNFSLFESLWYNVVTFSTVGYGDYRPDIWPSQVFMTLMIVVGITVLPVQLEKLAYAWIERNKLGASYSRHRAQTEKHVVVCTTALQSDTIMDFLNEFYAHPRLQAFYVCLLSPCELDSTMKMIMQVPIWAERVIFIQGSALKDIDLARCRMQDAEACFILAPNNYQDRTAADQHTIMRSWAVKDFAPHCPQYVQLYRPENKFHVIFAEHVVCEDEFKYALLANNAMVPGISTLVTLLLHTSRGQEGQTSTEEWQQIYGKCSGNEVYHIRLGESRFFKEYLGKSFTFASFHAHRKYGVSLVAVSPDGSASGIQLNPGPRHLMQPNDVCFYLSITKEENSAFILSNANASSSEEKDTTKSHLASTKELLHDQLHSETDPSLMRSSSYYRNSAAGIPRDDLRVCQLSRSASARSNHSTTGGHRCRPPIGDTEGVLLAAESSLKLMVPGGGGANGGSGAPRINRSPRGSIAPVPDYCNDFFIKIQSVDEPDDVHLESPDIDCVKGCPPVIPYIGTSPCLCHLMKHKRSLCCLELVRACIHCPHENVLDYAWTSPSVIVCADFASYGLFNFIVPLRSHWRSRYSLKPIILLLEKEPETYFLEAISYFPLIYWMLGSIECLDDLLKAGIILADNVVIVNKESSNSAEEETLADCNTIVAVQTIYRLFPRARIITELSRSSNMRFALFSPDDKYALNMSKVEKKERARGSHISYIFRLPFAAGNVFSASMLDTLLYQTFVKSYLIKFVRLLLGVDQAVGSGHLTCCHILEEDLWIRTYGRLYQKLCSSSCEIPIGIYRTLRREKTDIPTSVSMNQLDLVCDAADINLQKAEMLQMIKCRLLNLGLNIDDYEKYLQFDKDDKYHSLSFVITNPTHDLPLQKDDIIYLFRPSSLSDKASPLIDERKSLLQTLGGKKLSRRRPGDMEDGDNDGGAGGGKSRSLVNIAGNLPPLSSITSVGSGHRPIASLSGNRWNPGRPVNMAPVFDRKSSQSLYNRQPIAQSSTSSPRNNRDLSRKNFPEKSRFYLETPQKSVDMIRNYPALQEILEISK